MSAKRKFGLKSLFAARPPKQSPDVLPSGDFLPHDSPSDTDSEEHFDPSAVNRAPPLDPRVEALLRTACAIIVQNLKPSGHDIEDTRMKSDALVEDLSDQDEDPRVTSLRPKKQHVAASQSRSKEQEQQPLFSVVSLDDETSGLSPAEIAFIHAKRRQDQQRHNKLLMGDHTQPRAGMDQTEAPLATSATLKAHSRGPSSAPSPPAAADPRNMAPLADALGAHPVAAATSENSDWTSGITAMDQYFPRAPTTAASAANWIRQEVEKRHQVQDDRILSAKQFTNLAFAVPPLSPQYQQAQAMPIVCRRASSAQSASVKPAAPTPMPVASTPEPAASTPKPVASTPEPAASTPTEPSHEQASLTIRRDFLPEDRHYTQPKDDRHMAVTPDKATSALEPDHDLRASPASAMVTMSSPEPRHDLEDQAPDTKPAEAAIAADDPFDVALAQIRARMAATSLSTRTFEQVVGRAGVPTDAQDLSNSERDSPSESRRRPKNPSWPIPPRLSSSSYQSSDRGPPRSSSSIKRRTDGTIKTNGPSRPVRDGAGAAAGALVKDVDPVEFDAFMSVVEQTNTGDSPRPLSVRSRPASNASRSPHLSAQDPAMAVGTVDAHATSSIIKPSSEDLDTHREQPMPSSQAAADRIPAARAGLREALPLDAEPPVSSFERSSTTPYAPALDIRTQQTNTAHPNTCVQVAPDAHAPRSDPVRSAASQRQHIVEPPSPNPLTQHPTHNLTSHTKPLSPRIQQPPSAVPFQPTPVPTRHSRNATVAGMHHTSQRPASFGLRNWLGRRKSLSQRQPGGTRSDRAPIGFGRGEACQIINGYDDAYDDEDYDDPLICAAPVVAFGRGW